MKKNSGTMNYQAYTAIKEMILRFELVPGQNVSDFALANQLGISRTPVREAISYLVKDGLIMVTERGQIVSPIAEDDMVDLCYAREALETMMLRLVIEEQVLTKEDMKYLRSLNEDISDKNIHNKIHLTFDPDESFHNFIATKSGSRRLQEQFKVLQLQMRRYRYLTLIDEQRTRLTIQEHQGVLDALERNDVQAAEEAMRRHLRTTVERYKSALHRMAVNDWITLIRNINLLQPFNSLEDEKEEKDDVF